MIRFLFGYVAKKMKAMSGDNKLVGCVVGVGTCLLACLERIGDYINTSAFAYCAVSGDSFCKSAWNALMLQLKHLAAFGWAVWIAKCFIFVGKLAIIVGNGAFLYLMMKLNKDTSEVSSYIGPMTVVAIVTYITANIFLGLFDTAAMSMMTSYAIDADMHDGKPKYGPPTFHDYVKSVKEEAK